MAFVRVYAMCVIVAFYLRPTSTFNILKAKPEGRGQTTSTKTPSYASMIPILNKMLAGHRKSTGSPQAIPQNQNSFHQVKIHTTPSRRFHHTAHTRAHLISCWAEQQHLLTITPTSHLHCLSSGSTVHTCNHTGVVRLIKCHGLTFDLLPRPPRHQAGIKDHTGQGNAHL